MYGNGVALVLYILKLKSTLAKTAFTEAKIKKSDADKLGFRAKPIPLLPLPYKFDYLCTC